MRVVRSVQVETHNIVELCDSHWGYGQIYRRFMEMIVDANHTGISIFNNVNIDHNGIMGAIADFQRNNGSLAKYGETKSIKVYGGTDKTRNELKALGPQMKWKTAIKYVSYQNKSCGLALVIGKGAVH